MSNPNKSYFDKYTDPVIREIDRVNIYEFENGMDYELTQSGKAINVDTIKEAQSKVLKNLKKDPSYYTNLLVNETINLVGEYGSGKKPGKRNTPQDAEKIKKDGKMPKANKQDAPFGKKEEVKGKYKSSGMEVPKKDKSYSHTKGTIKEGMDYDISNQDTSDDPAAYGHGSMRSFENQEDKDLEMIRNAMKRDVRGTKKPAAPAPKNEYFHFPDDSISRKGSPEWQKMVNKPQDVLNRRMPGEVLKDKEGYRKVVNKTGKTGEFYGNVGPKGQLPEDVNVKDSRTIRLTPTTKNQILTLVHEAVKSIKEGILNPEDVKNAQNTGDVINIPKSDTSAISAAKSAKIPYSTYGS